MAEPENKKRTLLRPIESFRNSVSLVLREYAEALAVALILAILIRYFVIGVYRIPTAAMVPTLKVGDFMFAYKIPYSFSPWLQQPDEWLPDRGQVVVFKCPQNPSIICVKRVVGLPGDHIRIVKKRLIINGQEAGYIRGPDELISDLPGNQFYAVVNETWNSHSRNILIGQSEEAPSYGPVVVPPNHFFVLGDNRDSSDDSRFWGPVPAHLLVGRVFLIWMSVDWSQGGRFPRIRTERLFQWVH